MKRFLKCLSAIVLAFTVIFSLASCSNSIGVYKEFSNAGATLSKNHVYESISSKKIINKLAADKEAGTQDKKIYTYVFFADAAEAKSREVVQVYNEQAKQYNISLVYYLNSDLSNKELTKVKDAFKMSRSSRIPALLVFINGELKFDSTLAKYDNAEATLIASKAFRDTK